MKHSQDYLIPAISKLLLLFCATAVMPACSLILGTGQPVDTKSHHYTVVRLDRDPSGDWHLLPTGPKGDVPGDSGDLAFENKSTGTIVSINSVCDSSRDTSLEDLSHYLLVGLNTKGPMTSRELEIDNVSALESDVEADMTQRGPSGENQDYPVKVRAVVTKKGGCTYDLMYIARPDVFDRHLPDFGKFLKGFHAKQ